MRPITPEHVFQAITTCTSYFLEKLRNIDNQLTQLNQKLDSLRVDAPPPSKALVHPTSKILTKGPSFTKEKSRKLDDYHTKLARTIITLLLNSPDIGKLRKSVAAATGLGLSAASRVIQVLTQSLPFLVESGHPATVRIKDRAAAEAWLASAPDITEQSEFNMPKRGVSADSFQKFAPKLVEFLVAHPDGCPANEVYKAIGVGHQMFRALINNFVHLSGVNPQFGISVQCRGKAPIVRVKDIPTAKAWLASRLNLSTNPTMH